VQDFIKPIFIAMTNQELYIYTDKNSQKHQDMHVLTPGVFINSKLPCLEESNLNDRCKKKTKYYPIEIILGSSIQ